MDTTVDTPAPSVRKMFITLPIRVPAECPWSEDQIRAALTNGDLYFAPTTYVQRYTHGGAQLILYEKEISLPPSIGKLVVGGSHPRISISEWEEVARILTAKGLRLALDKTEVTIPYNFFSITI